MFDLVCYYYECWDGIGYFLGLCGDNIFDVVCIFSIVDVYDVLISEWFYKFVWSFECVLQEICVGVGVYFDLQYVEVFFYLMVEQDDVWLVY